VIRHADLQGLVMQRSFLGQEFASYLESGLKGLASSPPELRLAAAPSCAGGRR